jgi:hypothetical protein
MRCSPRQRARLEAPWSTLGVTPGPGKQIGLDVQVNDDDDGGDRDTKVMWHAQRDTAWQQPSVFGTGDLAGLLGWWSWTRKDGTQAADKPATAIMPPSRAILSSRPAASWARVALDGNGDHSKSRTNPRRRHGG